MSAGQVSRQQSATAIAFGVMGVAVGVVLGKSPVLFAWIVYVAIVAVCSVASFWIVREELRERGRLRHPVIDQVLVDHPSARHSRADALDVIVGPAGPFTRVGTKR